VLEQAGAIIALAADHSTDCNSGAHTADPVPVLLCDPESARGSSHAELNFSERACRTGNMPRQSSHELLLRLLEKMAG
jgi:2,3-bisphosphoglycerate-independent phosphoglycerate mutase